MLINLLRDERPTHVAVAFDLSRQTWRSAEFVSYKANRSSAPNEFHGQIALLREVLTAMRIDALTAENYEADDIIATLTVRALAQDMTVAICTGDRDAIQLVNDDVTVLYPIRGVSDLTRWTPESVFAKYALRPLQYPDFAAIRGDPSDNLPNIPGVGEKTAAKWIQEYGSLTDLVDRVDQVPGKAGLALREALPQVLMNRRLTELVKDVPVDVDPLVDLLSQPYDRDALHDIFDQLQFRVLRERLLETFEQVDVTSDEKFQLSGGVLAPGTVRAWLTENTVDADRVGIWARGGWALGDGDVRMLSIAAPGGKAAAMDPVAAHPRRRRRAGRLVGRRFGGEGRSRRQARRERAGRSGLDAARDGGRHRVGRLSGTAGPALVRPRRPGAALPAPHAHRGSAGDRGRPAVAAGRRAGRRGRQRPTRTCCTRSRCSTWTPRCASS